MKTHYKQRTGLEIFNFKLKSLTSHELVDAAMKLFIRKRQFSKCPYITNDIDTGNHIMRDKISGIYYTFSYYN